MSAQTRAEEYERQPRPGPPARLVVDLDALARNYTKLRALAAPADCAAVVKADAYGLGIAPVARRLAREGCRRYFVATADEGHALRALLPGVLIYVLGGAPEGGERGFAEAGLTPVLNSLRNVERWARAGRAAAALHIDTGMARLGLEPAEIAELVRRPAVLASLELDLVMTHLACADEPEHALNRRQLEDFEALRRGLPAAPVSIANTAGIFLGAPYRGDVVRPGIGLYGGNPFAAGPSPVEPVVTLEGRVLQLRDVAAGGTVGYGATYCAAAPARLAVLGVGYADGYPRRLGNCCHAAFRGLRLPIVGRVSMDMLCVDVSALAAGDLGVGDYVELIGPTVSLDEVAAAAGTIGYEILTGLGARLERRYSGLEPQQFG